MSNALNINPTSFGVSRKYKKNKKQIRNKQPNRLRSAVKNGNYYKSRRDKYVEGPSAMGIERHTVEPMIMSSKGKTRIIHREPFGILENGTGNFLTFQTPVNPGLIGSFPWLSQTAQNFEAYKFNKLCIEYLTSTPTSTGGSVVIAPDYNSADGLASSIQELEQYQDAFRTVVWADGVCELQLKSMGLLGPARYIRLGQLAPNLDIKTYDVATINVGSVCNVNNAPVGELWVSYDVELYVPTSFNFANTSYVGILENATGAGAATTNLLGTNINSAGRIQLVPALNVITVTNISVGDNYYALFIEKAAVITTAPTLTFDGTYLTTGTLIANGVNAAATQSYAYYRFTVATTNSSNTGTITLGGTSVLTTPSYASLTVSILPSAIPL